MLKQSVHIQSPADIPLSSFEEYVKAVNNSEDPFFQVDEDIVHFNYRFVHDEFQVMFHELDSDVSLEEINKGIKQLKGGVAQWVTRLTRDPWILVSREFEPHQRPSLFL